MSVTVKPISSKSELKEFFKFKIDLYKGNNFFVPPLYADEFATFDPKMNPAFDFCERQAFVAYRDGKIVGRIAAIINHKANDAWNNKNGRFGFFDFIDDLEVSKALMDTAIEWCRSKNMNAITGPLGFTDMDREGMLIEGFEEIGTMVTDYNYPYYEKHIDALGFVKDVDWHEMLITIPETLPEKFIRVANLVEEKFKLRTLKFKNTQQVIKEGWGYKAFELINDAYAPLYGFSALSKRQIDYYVKQYLPLLPVGYICCIVNEAEELVGFGVAMPSISKALQKSQGKLFPFGFVHLLKALKAKNPVVELLLIAVRPDYQGKGVNALAFRDMFLAFKANGAKYAETNPELEVNNKVQNQWDTFETRRHKLRRAYHKSI